jgi:hypothetical protein
VQLERLAVHLRRRSPWEAIDLGCAMARTWWRPMLAVWLPLYLPAAIVAHVIFPDNQIAALLVLWWLKPVFDRAALDVVAHRVFGEPRKVFDVLAAVFRSPGLIASLTLYRFDLARSFNLPVWHLERLRGAAATARARALHGRSRGHAVWTTVVFLHFELLILFSFWAAIDLFTPGEYQQEFELAWFFAYDAAPWQLWLQSIFYVCAVTLLEPFYVASGFALYLNRRTQLEAWDVELALRRLAKRLSGNPARALVTLLAAFTLGLSAPDALSAAAQEQSPRVVVQEILQSPEFNQHREVKRWRYTGPGWSPDSDEPAKTRDSSFGSGFAEVARALMWIVVVGLLLAAILASRRYWRTWLPEARAEHKPPSTLFGLDIAPESLPPEVAGAALSALDAGRVREALSLLYRGALSALVTSGELEVRAGDTEGECVRRVTATGTLERAQYFARLVAAWQTAAYAKRMPGTDAMRELCDDWRAHFAPPAAA